MLLDWAVEAPSQQPQPIDRPPGRRRRRHRRQPIHTAVAPTIPSEAACCQSTLPTYRLPANPQPGTPVRMWSLHSLLPASSCLRGEAGRKYKAPVLSPDPTSRIPPSRAEAAWPGPGQRAVGFPKPPNGGLGCLFGHWCLPFRGPAGLRRSDFFGTWGGLFGPVAGPDRSGTGRAATR